MLSRKALDLLYARSRNRLSETIHLILHRIAREMQLRKYEQVDSFLSRRTRLDGDRLEVLILPGKLRAGLS